MINTPNLNKNNIYHTKLSHEQYLIYAPFASYAFITKKSELLLLETFVADSSTTLPAVLKKEADKLFQPHLSAQVVQKNKSPEMFTRLFIIPTNRCNFSCDYCFSAKGRATTDLQFETLKKGIDFFIAPEKIKSKYLSMSFVGGGEPLLNFDLIRDGLHYASSRAQNYGYSMDYSIITNGSKIDKAALALFKKYDVAVTVSYEILEKIQNEQRGHFQEVTNAIQKLSDEGIFTRIRATITPGNVHLQETMVTKLLERFPNITELFFENVTDSSLSDRSEFRKFHQNFTDHFFKAQALAQKKQCRLMCTAWLNAGKLMERYCPGYLILNPDGNLSLCTRVTSPHEKGYEKLCYGKIANQAITYDSQKFHAIMNYQPNSDCDTCFAKLHCAGGCFGQHFVYSEAQIQETCHFTREFTKQYILTTLINKRVPC
jgi:radical SAM protein with 4Fe4S-binding SPASM domain